MTSKRILFSRFIIGFSIFILANILAAHLQSDCGLPAVFGLDYCSDDIARAGFPLIFFEEGGFDFRSRFDSLYLLVDIFIGFGFGLIYSLLANWIKKRKER